MAVSNSMRSCEVGMRPDMWGKVGEEACRGTVPLLTSVVFEASLGWKEEGVGLG